MDDVSAVSVAEGLAERLLDTVRLPVDLDGQSMQVGMSVGIATGTGASSTVGRLLRNADLAMYEAKAGSRGEPVTFREEMHRRLVDRLELEADLAEAVSADQLRLVYQPVVELATGRVVGLEALLRWHHPVRGLVSPSLFVPVAEECGAMSGIGEWVLQRSCDNMAAWRRDHVCAGDLNLAVNLSASELDREDLAGSFATALAKAGLEASALVVEITETSVSLDDTALVAARLGELRRMGIEVALDDFGTGHSSIAHLRSLPAAIVKVDRSFVAEMTVSDERRALVLGIVGLGNALGLDTVAEGIETPGQLALLTTVGCRYGQGYLFSEPLSPDEVAAALAETRGGLWTLGPVAPAGLEPVA